MNLDEFLTEGLINSLNNGLIPPELVTVYAGNYLAKSLITQDDMTKIQTAVTAYQTTSQTQATDSANESSSESAAVSTNGSTSTADSISNSTAS